MKLTETERKQLSCLIEREFKIKKTEEIVVDVQFFFFLIMNALGSYTTVISLAFQNAIFLPVFLFSISSVVFIWIIYYELAERITVKKLVSK